MLLLLLNIFGTNSLKPSPKKLYKNIKTLHVFELANQKNNEIDISHFVVELMTHPNPTQSTTSGKYEVKTKKI